MIAIYVLIFKHTCILEPESARTGAMHGDLDVQAFATAAAHGCSRYSDSNAGSLTGATGFLFQEAEPTAPRICVWLASGRLVLEVSSEDAEFFSIWKLKSKISDATGVTPTRQQLLVGDQLVNDRAELRDFWPTGPQVQMDVQVVVLPEPQQSRVTTPTRMRPDEDDDSDEDIFRLWNNLRI